MGSRLPVGNEPVATVARFNLWTLEWNARGLGPFRARYWNAPIFFPSRGTFAYSDPQPLTGAVFHGLRLAGFGATTAYALVLLIALVLNATAASRLLEGVGVGPLAATLGGALMLTLPFVANEFGVLQLVTIFPILYCFDAFFRYFRGPEWKNAVLVGVWIAVAFLTSEYYGFFLLVSLAVAVVVMALRRRLRADDLPHAALAGGTALLLAGPFLVTQSARIAHFRSADRNGRDARRVRPRLVPVEGLQSRLASPARRERARSRARAVSGHRPAPARVLRARGVAAFAVAHRARDRRGRARRVAPRRRARSPLLRRRLVRAAA
jgi:hypothetical protein